MPSMRDSKCPDQRVFSTTINRAQAAKRPINLCSEHSTFNKLLSSALPRLAQSSCSDHAAIHVDGLACDVPCSGVKGQVSH